MNFFAHLVIAAERSRDEAFVLGAMLPDLGSMGRFSWMAIRDDRARAGVALHHETDRIFHALERFRRLMDRGCQELSPLGLRRALARGLAHLAVELLLDGELARRREDRNLFRRSIATTGGDRSQEILEQTPEDRTRWSRLRARLLDGVLPSAYAEPEFVAERIIGICRSRPRLALPDGIAPELKRWTAGLQQRVVEQAASLVDDVLAELG